MAAFTPEFLKSSEMQDIIKQVSAMYSSSTGSLVTPGQKNNLEFRKAEAQMGATNPALASKGTLGATRTEVQNIKAAQQPQQAPTPKNTPAANDVPKLSR